MKRMTGSESENLKRGQKALDLRGVAWVPMLLLASVLLLVCTWFVVEMVRDGISARMMTFESEPQEGWDYWRWYYIKRTLFDNLTTWGVFAALWAFLCWGWIRLLKRLFGLWKCH